VATLTDLAIVVDQRPFRDRHRILTVLAKDYGLLRGVWRGASGRRNPGGAAGEILSRVHVTVFAKPSAEMVTYNAVDLERSSYPLAGSIERAASAAVVAELMLTFCVEGQPDPRHFRLADAALEALLARVAPATVVAYSQLWMVTLSGVLPEVSVCSACGEPLGAGFAYRSLDAQPVCAEDVDEHGSPLVAADGARWLAEAARRHVRDVGAPPQDVIRWLDRVVRIEAHRPLRALDFLRATGE
jgi:DNA repair protein RecO